jgi:hypothetical protein
MPQISAFEASIPANSQAAVRVTYYDGQVGSVPNSSFGMVVYVLGSNGSDTFYIGSQARNWNPTELVNGTAGAKPMVPSQDIENPVATYITQIPSSQSYQASIFIRDPIDQGCSAIVTQALPAGIAILGTDGQVIGASIVWTNGISTNKLAKDSFSFSAPLVPGALMNLPPPSVVFVDETNNQSSAVLAVAFGFSGVFPVQASGSIPNGISGTDLSMPIVITNLTGINQSGSLTISLTNFTGVGVSSFSQSFSVGSFGTNILTFVLPGNIPPGQYRLTGTLSVSGGSGQVLAGIYTMPVAPLVLGLNPVSPLATSGLNLMLQGQVGSNALVMASSDLLNWTPIRYVSITNSPSYFNDTSATNYNERFYRAVMR